jgi:hypothetical protein
MKALFAASLALAALGASIPAEAQVRGSYRATCTEVRQRGPILEAYCQDRRGELRPTRLDIRDCGRGDVANQNGRLVCSGARGERGGGYDRGDGYGRGRGNEEFGAPRYERRY